MNIGIDLGGTKIEGIVLAEDGTELLRERVATPQGDYEATLAAIASLVAGLERSAGQQCPVGIGMPGSLSRVSGLVKNANSVCLNGKPLHRDLETMLGRELRFANDADCFALSEACDGAATGAGIVFGVIIGTGTGGGIVIDGKPVSGPDGISGEWGHNPLPWPRTDEMPGPACYCGLSGCIETWLSGPGLSRDHRETHGSDMQPLDISKNAELGDVHASASIARYTDRMARALATVINVIDPDVIVLGGGVSNIAALYKDVPACWEQYIFSDKVETRLVRALHGDSSGVRGAARLWP